MSCQRNRFLADALHQAAVAGQDIRIVVDELVAEACVQHALCESHADRRRDALSQRTRRHLHAGGVPVLGVTGGPAAELAEVLQLVEAHGLVAGQVQQSIDQHRAVAGGKHEAIAVLPFRILRIEFQESREQHGGNVRHPHRHAGMTRIRALHCVCSQQAQRIGHVFAGGDGARVLSFRNRVHVLSSFSQAARRLRSISFMISGVNTSCMARSCFPPGITMELARDMKLSGIIVRR